MSFQHAVAAAYRAILQRDPTDQELAEALGGGESEAALATLISTLSQGSEAQTFVWPVMRIYQGVYGRVPDEGGLGYWVDRYRAEDVQALDNPATATVNEALVALARVFTDPVQTPEFVQRFGTDPSTATYVEALYVNVLNRAPDEGGRLYWVARFESLMAELEAQSLSASAAKAEARAIFLEQFVLSQEYTVASSELAARFLAASAHGVETFEGDLWERDENYAPIPRDDAATVDEDGLGQVDVLANDLDLDDGDTPSTFSLGSVVVTSVTGAQVTVEELNAAAAATVVGGKLQFNAAGLFNDLPAGGQATVTIAYEVIDDGGASSTGEAVITVVGANDAPTQISLSANDVPENAPGALVGLLNAVDPDTGASIVYSLVEQSGAQSHLFTIVGNELRVGPAGIDYEALLNPLFVVVRASDGQEQLREAFGIDVINVDEGGPVFTSGTTASIQENQPTGTIYTAVASDPAGPISYALAGPDALLFNINGATGALSFKASPDFEAPWDSNQDNIYEVIIIASDAVGEQSQRSVSIHVTNLEDQGPSFTSGTTASVAENVATTTAVYTAAASDPNGPVSYALSGTDAALFALNATTGALTFLASPDHEAPGDAGGNNVYDVVITAADALGNETQRAVAITVTDVDEVGPSFTSGTTASVAENVATTTAVYTAAASDPNGPVSYALSGTDAALFALNATTGALTFLASPDYEAPGDAGGNNVYDVVITAADALGNETQQAVAITVTDVDEVGPSFTSGTTASVAENVATTTAVYTAAASDPNGPVSYALSGTDAALFALNATTGALTFLASPDHEAPGDAGGNNVYDVVITAADALGNETQQAVAITVTDVDEVGPSFTSGTTASVAENVATTTAVYTAAASDPNGPVSYALSGTDAALFALNATTGALTFLASPDHEAPGDAGGNNVYDVVITAADALGNETQQAVAITVTDVDEVGPSFTSGTTASVAENVATTTAVYTAAASDPNGPVSYALSGTDAALFALNATTGALTFLASPDHEAPGDAGGNNVYDVVITAADALGNETQQAVAITVTDVDEVGPSFTSGTTASVAENVATTTAVYTAAASDPNGPVSYALSGTDAALFALNATTGALTFLASPDHEAPGDAGGNNVYDVVITAADALGNETQQAVAITVTDVDEVGPSFTSGTTASVAENVATTAAVYTAAATDPSGPVTYALSGIDAALFALNATTGALTFLASPDHEAPGDAGGNNVYDVVITAADALGNETQRAVAITVTDVDEVGPSFTSGTTASVAENVATTTAVYTAAASDPNGPVTYALSGTDAALFALNATTGALTFLASPDHEAPGDAGGNNVYDVVITAADALGNETQQAVAITVTDVDEVGPSFTSGTTASVAENVATTTAVYTAAASDPNGPVSYALSGTDAALFALNATTGALTFLASPDHEAPGDAGGNNVYDVVITAADALGNETQQAVAITVTDVDEVGPSFTSGTTASVAENVATTTAVYTAAASDPNGPVSYALSGTDAALFALNATTGALTFLASPDHEAPGDAGGNNVYDVVITAADALGNETQQAVAITVTDVDEVGPSFTSGTTASVAENVATTTAVYTAAASDPNGPVSYALSGTDAALFALNATTGALTFLASPDHEAPGDAGGNNVYDVVITAADALGNETQQAVAITVTDVDEVGPSFTSGTTASVAENVATTTAVYTAAASDPNGPVSYALSGTDAALFALNATTGALTFLASPDHEAPGDAGGNNVYDVVITAADALGNETQQAVAITVTDASIQLVSVSSTEVQGNSTSYAPSISGDGRYVTFQSFASNLVAGDSNGAPDIFVRDLMLGTTTRVSVDSAATQGNSWSYHPSISADGRFVTFLSQASNLVTGDTNGTYDIFVRDLTLGTTARVSVDSAGVQGNNSSYEPSISADGRYVTFRSDASNLVAGDINAVTDIFVRDLVDGTTTLVSVSSAGAQGNDVSVAPSISADGRFVTFQSNASNLVSGDTNLNDIFIRDLANGTTALVSVNNEEIQGTGNSQVPSISANGRYVAFQSFASDLVVGDTNQTWDVFVRDLIDGTTTRVSVDSEGVQTNGGSYLPSISADGRYVTFLSSSSNLVAGDTNGVDDIFVRDLTLGITVRVSVDSAGVQGNGFSTEPSISADGRYVTFRSTASNLVAGDTNGATSDIFVVDGLEQGWWFQGPSFTSGTTASIAENVATTTAVYTAAASDPNGPVSYALSGTDAALFALSATTGALTFLASPDHEAPGDAGGNNVYDVVITAADALGNETQQAVAITVTNALGGNISIPLANYNAFNNYNIDNWEPDIVMTMVSPYVNGAFYFTESSLFASRSFASNGLPSSGNGMIVVNYYESEEAVHALIGVYDFAAPNLDLIIDVRNVNLGGISKSNFDHWLFP